MSLVQTSSILRTTNSGSSSTLAFGSNLTAGNAAFLFVGNYPSGISTVSGSTNGSYTKAVGYIDSATNAVEIWYKLNVSAGAETLTITPTATSGNYISAVAVEHSGIAASGALDQTGTVNNNNTVTAAGANNQADMLVLSMAVADAGSSNIGFGTPTGYTLTGRENDSNTYTGFQAVHKIVGASETSSATITTGVGAIADQVISTFKIASGAFSAAITEASTAAEVSAQALAASATRTEASAATETSVAAAASAAAITEAASAGESSTRAAAAAAAITEAVAASDSSSAAAAGFASVTEPATASDDSSASAAGSFSAAATEGAAATDTSGATAAGVASITESASASEASSGTGSAQAAITEAADAEDAYDAAIPADYPASVIETAAPGDSASAVLGPANQLGGGGLAVHQQRFLHRAMESASAQRPAVLPPPTEGERSRLRALRDEQIAAQVEAILAASAGVGQAMPALAVPPIAAQHLAQHQPPPVGPAGPQAEAATAGTALALDDEECLLLIAAAL